MSTFVRCASKLVSVVIECGLSPGRLPSATAFGLSSGIEIIDMLSVWPDVVSKRRLMRWIRSNILWFLGSSGELTWSKTGVVELLWVGEKILSFLD